MQLVYGNYQFDPNSTTVQVDSHTVQNEAGIPLSIVLTFAVKGYLTGTSQLILTLAESALRTALARPYQDLRLLQDSGLNSADVLLNANSITGVRIIEGPSFTDTMGPEYAVIRSFKFAAQAEYPLLNTANLLMRYVERLIFTGGGPLYAHRPALNGLPQKQLIYPNMPYQVVQTGQIVGYRNYPPVPGPKFPDALKESPRITTYSPSRRGLTAYQGYGIEYSYLFESATPLVDVPSLWTG